MIHNIDEGMTKQFEEDMKQQLLRAGTTTEHVKGIDYQHNAMAIGTLAAAQAAAGGMNMVGINKRASDAMLEINQFGSGDLQSLCESVDGDGMPEQLFDDIDLNIDVNI